MSKKARKALGYARVSTEEQAKEGVSLDAQEEHIRRYCELYGLDLAEILIDEGRSGKDMDRPAMRELMERVERGEAEAVVVYKLDRLSRDTVDTLLFQRQMIALGICLHSTTEELGNGNADDEFRMTITAGVNQYERKKIAERTKMALAHKKDRGEWVGRPPVGYQVSAGRLVPDPNAKGLVAKAKRLRRRGKSVRAIASRLSVSVGTAHSLLNGHGKSRKAKYGAEK